MKSLPLDGHTRRLGAPANWDHAKNGICHTLEIIDAPNGFMVSAWAPSDAERQRIAAGAPIYLHIQGNEHPVIRFTIGTSADVEELDGG